MGLPKGPMGSSCVHPPRWTRSHPWSCWLLEGWSPSPGSWAPGFPLEEASGGPGRRREARHLFPACLCCVSLSHDTSSRWGPCARRPLSQVTATLRPLLPLPVTVQSPPSCPWIHSAAFYFLHEPSPRWRDLSRCAGFSLLLRVTRTQTHIPCPSWMTDACWWWFMLKHTKFKHTKRFQEKVPRAFVP